MNHPHNAPDVFHGHADVMLWIDASPLMIRLEDLRSPEPPEPLTITVPDTLQDQFEGQTEIQATWTAADDPHHPDWSLAPGGRLYQWLVEYFQHQPMCLAPVGQPERVHELTGALFNAFQLEQGSLQLGGCTMEDRPVLFQTRSTATGEWTHRFFFRDLIELNGDRLKALRLEQLESSPPSRSRAMSADDLADWSRLVDDHLSHVGDRHAKSTVVMQAIVWCKFAKGELTASDEGEHLRLPFEGWAAELLSGDAKPPPYCEPATGDTSYELVRLDDGRLTAATAAGVCQASNRRVLRTQLQKCPATDTLALKEFFSTCPVTGDQVFSEGMRPCPQCRQLVGAHCQDSHGICKACRELKSAGPEDPRLARILGEHPGLSVWRRWRMSETSEVYILGAAALMRKLLVVLDKESLAPRHLAVRSRFAKTWATPSDLEQEELLAGR